MVEKNSGLVRISKKYVFWDTLEFLHWTISNATKDHCHVTIIDKYLIASFFQLAKQQQQMQSLGQLVNLLLKVVELKVIVLGTRVLLI